MRRFPLDDARELLEALGLTKRADRPKVQQLEHLLPWLLDDLDRFDGKPLIEFACGKGYLSFAFRYAAQQSGRDSIPVVCFDSSEEVLERCESIRDRLGWGEMEFRVVRRGEVPQDLPEAQALVSLHACDCATDQAIATGVAAGAQLLLHVPCCHSTVQRTLREADHRHSLGYLCRSFPLLGEALSHLLTEGLRCAQLRACGYETIMRTFVSPRVTPKNLLIIGRRTGKPNRRAAGEVAALSQEYRLPPVVMEMLQQWGNELPRP